MKPDAMAATYLKVPFAANGEVRSLGARFDSQTRRWYVPDGYELAPFKPWLPKGPGTVSSDATATGSDLSVAVPVRGISLSRLLSGVGAAVAEAYQAGIWVTAEVLRASGRDGHVYLELSERDAAGRVVAKTQAAIWASTATRIVPRFERATGVTLGAGIKLLLRARPVFKAQYGFSLEIEAIDPDYTLGDLEARKREIRSRLQAEGVFENNRSLLAPWDFSAVLVVAPQQGAGLGDFQQEAMRLEHFGICRFAYAFSRFQGEGAASEIVVALRTALDEWPLSQPNRPDAIVIIRGGGAVNDLAWLNDYALARFICDSELPVFTGIGHQRDSTILDEVAHLSFDTPSKVITGIEQQISRRAAEAKRNFQSILDQSTKAVQRIKTDVERLDLEVRSQAVATVSGARSQTEGLFSSSRLSAFRTLHEAASDADGALASVRGGAVEQLAQARSEIPALMRHVRNRAVSNIAAARQGTQVGVAAVLERARIDVQRSEEDVRLHLRTVEQEAQRSVQGARIGSEALMREISGQGPQKTLGRGFAMVQAENGKTIASAASVPRGAGIRVTFHDGSLDARVVQPKREEVR
jgi:exodeoxyribonuclease VII large subunit